MRVGFEYRESASSPGATEIARVYDVDTGEAIEFVTSVAFQFAATGSPVLHLTVIPREVKLEAQASLLNQDV